MAIIGGPCYCVMFGAGPPAPHQTATRDRWKRTTLAYMGARGQQQAAKELGVRFVGAHTRAIYSRLVTGDPSTLTIGESQGAFQWGDWAALAPQFWLGARRLPGSPERDMAFDPADMRSWPYRYMAAMAEIYGWAALTSAGLFLDADVTEWLEPLKTFAVAAHREGIKVYLNGGGLRNHDLAHILTFDGLFYEAVHVGKPYEAESRENAEVLLERTGKQEWFWTGVQVRFDHEPTAEELAQWSQWFLKARRAPSQSVTFVVQPEGKQPRELHCPDALDPGTMVTVKPQTIKPGVVPQEEKKDG